jgi:hypothetical protein
MTRHSLSLYDFRDMDLMMKLAGEGAATAGEMSDALGFKDEGTHSVATRFAWMKKYGMVIYSEQLRQWSLSDGGERVVQSHVKSASIPAIEKIPDEQMVDVMAHITTRQHHNQMLGHMLRREFLYNLSKSRR